MSPTLTSWHKCPVCDTGHWPKATQLDRAISGAFVGFMVALLIVGLAFSVGCAQRAHDARPDSHPGGNAVERMTYCAKVHSGAHLPVDQGECERW